MCIVHRPTRMKYVYCTQTYKEGLKCMVDLTLPCLGIDFRQSMTTKITLKKNGTRAFLISHSLGHDTSIGWPLSLTYVVRELFLQTRGPTKGKKLLFKILQSNPSILYASTSYGKRKRENDYKRKEMEKRVQEFCLRKRGKKDYKGKRKRRGQQN